MSSALRRKGTDGSMRKRRARSLAGDDAFTKAESAPDCRCGPAIPTQTCAPARHAGSSTNDCRDHQPPILAAWRTRSHSLAGSDRSSIRRKSWPGRRAENARLRRQGKRRRRRGHRIGLKGLRILCRCPRPGAVAAIGNVNGISPASDAAPADRRRLPAKKHKVVRAFRASLRRDETDSAKREFRPRDTLGIPIALEAMLR